MAERDDDIEDLETFGVSTTPNPVCFGCMRYRGTWKRCDAFGEAEIPDVIWTGGHRHRTPVEGDGGKLFDPAPGLR